MQNSHHLQQNRKAGAVANGNALALIRELPDKATNVDAIIAAAMNGTARREMLARHGIVPIPTRLNAAIQIKRANLQLTEPQLRSNAELANLPKHSLRDASPLSDEQKQMVAMFMNEFKHPELAAERTRIPVHFVKHLLMREEMERTVNKALELVSTGHLWTHISAALRRRGSVIRNWGEILGHKRSEFDAHTMEKPFERRPPASSGFRKPTGPGRYYGAPLRQKPPEDDGQLRIREKASLEVAYLQGSPPQNGITRANIYRDRPWVEELARKYWESLPRRYDGHNGGSEAELQAAPGMKLGPVQRKTLEIAHRKGLKFQDAAAQAYVAAKMRAAEAYWAQLEKQKR